MHGNAHSISLLCELMRVSRSSYYDRFERVSVTSSQSEITRKLIAAFHFHKRRYGTRRLVSELADDGIQVGRQTVRTILADHGLRAIQPKSFVPKTTRTHPNLRRSPNLLLEREPARAPDEIYVSVIKYKTVTSSTL
ncbi:IS3 family transposase [Neolewinella aurantiaca]|uniref:IS3 family transposase n=1 Tax=Neolewinella aurantiaca TaxID=2602767 RepID=A0A5C7FEE4_9BACT|nr:IS3 family transposase [Neolewinella aurantiaca]